MAKNARTRMKAVPAEPPERTFQEIFEDFLLLVERLHGEDIAKSYRALREQEALLVQSTKTHADYPNAALQLQQFLSFRTANPD